MSTTASILSFQTAPESPPAPFESKPQAPGYRTPANTDFGSGASICNEKRSPNQQYGKAAEDSSMEEDVDSKQGRIYPCQNTTKSSRSPKHAASPDRSHIIESLIESLNNSEASLGSLHGQSLDAYTFEPLGSPQVRQGTCSSSLSLSHKRSTRYLRSLISGSMRDSKASSEKFNTNSPFRSSQEITDHSIAEVPDYGGPESSERNSTEVGLEQTYPTLPKLTVILLSLFISIFLVALDRTILGPAIPEITNRFDSIRDIGWYGSSYMLTACGFILLYGRIYTHFDTKRVFMMTIILFEVGSALCGAATTSKMFILGRAIAGLGSSGIYTGVVLIILEIVPLHRRPLVQGMFGACFGVASVAGPLLGGTFTGSALLTWRWCFFINIPLGILTIITTAFLLHMPDMRTSMPWKQTILNLDPLGTILFMPSIVSLLLALEWGSTSRTWDGANIIALLATFGVLFIAFIAWQYHTRNSTATIPSRILKQRSVVCGCVSQFGVGANMLTCALYIPLWFQAVRGDTAMQSGIQTIPLVLSVVVGAILSGAAVHRIGYYSPFMIAGSIMLCIGAGLLTTWRVWSRRTEWIGYQAILGLGVGFTMQHPNLAVQIALAKEDVPTATALLSLFQTLGGALFASVGQSLFLKHFVKGLQNIRGIPLSRVLKVGATELKNTIPEAYLHEALIAYNYALTKGPFLACLIVGCFTVPAALGMEWFSVKRKGQAGSSPTICSTDKESTNRSGKRSPSIQAVSKIAMESALSSTPPNDPQRSYIFRKSGEFRLTLIRKLNPDLKCDLEKSTDHY